MKHFISMPNIANLIVGLSFLLYLVPGMAASQSVAGPITLQAGNERTPAETPPEDFEFGIFLPIFASSGPTPTPALTPTPAPTPAPAPEPPGDSIEEVAAIIGSAGGDLVSATGHVHVNVPPNALDQEVELRVAIMVSHMAEQSGSGMMVSIDLSATGAKGPVAFVAPLDVRFELGDLLDLSAVWEKPERLRAHFYDLHTRTGDLVALQIEPEKPGTMAIQAAAPGLYFLESGDNLNEGWKLLFNDAQVDLFSGGASYDVPIDLPPGRNGLTPPVTLSYNSRRVDGILSWAQSDWAGLGWSVDSPQIVRQVKPLSQNGQPIWMWGWFGTENKFTLLFNGASYDLVPAAPGQYFGRYHTKSEDFLYVERRNKPWCAHTPGCDQATWNQSIPNRTKEYWIVRTKDGAEFRFGFVDDELANHSEQLVTNNYYSSWECDDPSNPSRPDCWFNINGVMTPPQNDTYAGEAEGQVAYRWRLDQVQDTSHNLIAYRYDEEPNGVRDAASYLAEIDYTTLTGGGWGYRVRFERGQRGDDGIDDRIPDWMSVPWYQTEYLKRIHVEAFDPATLTWPLVRRYDLAYQCVASSCAGETIEGRQLSTITQVGRDGVTAFPTGQTDPDGGCQPRRHRSPV